MTAADSAPDGLDLPGYDQVLEAAGRLAGVAHRTPVLTCSALDQRVGAQLFFKCENFQRVGAFKFRGAWNTVAQLDDEAAARGVLTHSSGNHAQALALSARLRGIPATIVMPEDAPEVKVRAVRGYGAAVIACASNVAAREEACEAARLESGATVVHPYDDPRIIAGAGTAALELLEEVPDLELVVAPVGGGGLLAGSCLATRGRAPEAAVWGAEPKAADDAQRSLELGAIQPSVAPRTIADGLRTNLGRRPFAILRRDLEGIATCSEEAIVDAMRWIYERAKLVVEPSSAVPLACMVEGTLPVAGKRVGVILSGGNVDLARLPW